MKIPTLCPSQAQFKTDRRVFLKSMACAGLASEKGLAPLQSRTSTSLATRRLDPNAALRVGMIGTSGHTELVLSALPKIPGARLVAYAMKDGQRLQTEVAKNQNADSLQSEIEQ